MKVEAQIVACKTEKTHQSARFIRDHLKLSVSEEAVRLVLVKHGLKRISLPPIKPIKRFVAQEPDELWQVDIMEKRKFPLVGNLYLILALDDHSRFILSGAKQQELNFKFRYLGLAFRLIAGLKKTLHRDMRVLDRFPRV